MTNYEKIKAILPILDGLSFAEIRSLLECVMQLIEARRKREEIISTTDTAMEILLNEWRTAFEGTESTK